MKKFVVIWVAGIFSAFSVNAQLNKLMSKYHEKNGITITQLDQSLYGLYQRERLSPESLEMLQSLKEVNLLELDRHNCSPDLCDKIVTQFRNILSNPDKYRLVKSQQNGAAKQLIYTQGKNGKTTDLVVWNQTPEQIDLIELRGDIRLDRIALLPETLNLPGLDALASLASGTSAGKHLLTEKKLRSAKENIENPGDGFFNLFEHLDELMGMFGDFHFPDMTFPEGFGENGNSRSSSVQIIEENGKTKLKIDAQNTNIIYIIDGQEMSGDSIQMPETILDAQLIPSRNDMKKTYLFITSREKIGDFISLKNGELTFRYNHQEYKYNLDKLNTPVLVIDGRISAIFDIDPVDILQIRPVSQLEKETGYYPNAEVIIHTRHQF